MMMMARSTKSAKRPAEILARIGTYIDVRKQWLQEEMSKNPTQENMLIIEHSLGELELVRQLIPQDPAASVTESEG